MSKISMPPVDNNIPKKKKKWPWIVGGIVIFFAILSNIEDEQKKEADKSEATANVAEVVTPEEPEIDSALVAELAPKFRESYDEFNKLSWVEPKTASKYNNATDFYTYFSKSDKGVSNLRFKVQYEGSDWLFIKNVTFLIGDETITYTPPKVERDNNTRVWEWFDVHATSDPHLFAILTFIMDAQSNGKPVKIRFQGRQYHRDVTLTKKQIDQIVDPIKYFGALKGN